MYSRSIRHHSGASLIEAAAGIIILIPLFLVLIDVIAVVVAQTQNDALAKHAARAAAQAATLESQWLAAQSVVNATSSTSLCSNPTLKQCQQNSIGAVTVTTEVTCNLPVPVPFGGPAQQVFVANAVEPIVNAPVPLGNLTAPATGSANWGPEFRLFTAYIADWLKRKSGSSRRCSNLT